MDRITQQVMTGLINHMAKVTGEVLEYQKGSACNGISWEITSRGGRIRITGNSARDLFDKTHAWLSGWYASKDSLNK